MKKIIFLFFLLIYASRLPGQYAAIDFDQKNYPERDYAFELKHLSKKAKYNARLLYYLCMKEVSGREFHRKGVDFFLEGNYSAAIQATQKALAIREQTLPALHADLGQSNYNLGVFFKYLSDYDQAETCFLNAISIFDHCDAFMSADSRREMATVLAEKGDYDAALEHLKAGIQKAGALGSPDFLADCYIEFGKIAHLKKNYGAGIDTLLKAKKIFDSIKNKLPEQEDAESRCYNNLATLFYETGDFLKALDYYNRSIDINIRTKNQDLLIRNFTNCGLVYLKLNNLTFSRRYLQEAMDLARKSGSAELQAICSDNLGEFFQHTGEYPKALAEFQRALNQLIPGYNVQDYSDNPPDTLLALAANKTDLLIYFSDKARAWKAYYQASSQKEHLQQAINNYLKADGLINLMRFEHREQQSKFFWRENTRPIYEQALDACYESGDVENAFYFFEKSKAAILLDALFSSNARNRLPDSIIRLEFQLLNDLIKNQEQLQSATQQSSSSPIREREALAAAQTRYKEFTNRLAVQFPSYHKARYSTEVVDLKKFQDWFLDDSTNFIHYFYGENFIYVLNIGKIDVFFNRMPRNSFQDSLILNFFDLCKDKNKLADQANNYPLKAFQVYQFIFDPAWRKATPINNRLVIAPDGLVNYIPFESLTSKPDPAPYYKCSFLLQDHLFHYVYSATVWQQQRLLLMSNNRKMIGFGPFSDKKDALFLSSSVKALNTLEKKFQGEFFTGQTARMESFLNNAPGFQVINLFTHASAHPDSIYPFIKFWDKNLYLNQLYGLSFPSDLVVLSACETGQGKNVAGEGILSLGMGFSHAGAKSLAVSLWKVNDNATAMIISRFFDYLAEGKSKAAALRSAKLDYIRNPGIGIEHKSPFYWAAFILTGDNGPVYPSLEVQSGKGILFWVILTGSVLIFCLLIQYFRNRFVWYSQK